MCVIHHTTPLYPTASLSTVCLSVSVCVFLQLRKAYFRQLEEIKSLKQQITVKDKRIRQLEEELGSLRTDVPGESNC